MRTLKLAGAAILLFAFLTLLTNAGLLFRREALHAALDPMPVAYSQPADRGRVARANATQISPGSISVAQMSRTPLGSPSVPQWPLFWILTAPQHEQTRCVEIMESWGKLVPPESLLFMGAEKNRTSRGGHRFIALDAPPQMKALKEFLAWKYVVTAFPDREWFVKGDDDTFFIVGNLNRYLEEYDPRLPYFLGCKFHLGGPGGLQYVSGGAGYALSRNSAHLMADATDRCLRYYGRIGEGDIAIAECLQTVGVVPEDTRDDRGRQRFHAFPYDYHANWFKMGLAASKWWYHDYVWGPEIEGRMCCDDNTTVSFHYMSTRMKAFKWPAVKELAFHGSQLGDAKLILGQRPGLSQEGFDAVPTASIGLDAEQADRQSSALRGGVHQ